MSTPLGSPAPLREPNLLKFGLRQMFLMVTLLTIVFTLIALTTGPWPWVIAFLAVMVAAHVLGNSIGTRLRDTSQDVVRWRSSSPNREPDDPFTTPLEEVVNLPVAQPNLAHFGRLVRGRRWYLLGGASVGFVTAGALLVLTMGYRMGLAGLAVGTFSGTVMGTWIAFLAVSFTTIARDAWRQAHGK